MASEDLMPANADAPVAEPVKLEAVAWEAEAERITEAVVKRAPDMLRRAMEAVYETMLYDVQDYLRENVLFNLSAELSSAKRRADEAEARALAAEAKVGRMREALKPFANVLETYRAMSPKHRRVTAINISHLRAARQALQDTQDA